jgi:hypothetical protein
MRLNQDQIGHIARQIVRNLLKEEMIIVDQPEQATELLVETFVKDFQAEDALNDEVRDLLQNYSEEINRGMVNYQELFRKVKAKMARERKIVI